MREFKYDVIQLIQGVRDRPCLWDKTSENYKDRVERRSAWEEIFNLLDDTYEDMTPEEKRITGEQILNKWTNIRDTFMKSLKTKMGRPKKKYFCYDHLKFLTKIIPEEDRNREQNYEQPAAYFKQETDTTCDFTITEEPGTTSSLNISSLGSFSPKKNSARPDFENEKSIDYSIDEVSYGAKPSKQNDFDAKSIDYTASEVSFISTKRSKRSDFASKSTDYSISEVSNSRKKRKSRFIFTDDLNDSKDSSYNKKKSKKVNAKDTSDEVNNHLNDIDFVEVDDNDPRIMNEDEAFFASLLPTIVKYNEDERLEFRIAVLGIMKKLKEKRKWITDLPL